MNKKEVQLTVKGMDCSGCANNVKTALEQLEEVESAEVLLSAEKARINTKTDQPDLDSIKKAVEDIGYHIPDNTSDQYREENESLKEKAQKSFRLFGLVFGAILLIVIAGEWLGLFQTLTQWIPFWLGALLVLFMGYPVFKQVIVAAKKGLVTPHALMALGSITALAAGEWVTAGIVVFFMRTGDYIESYTTEKARDSLRSLTKHAPQTATVLRDDTEQEIPIDQVKQGDKILVRPGGKIPVDGTVIDGQATIDESPITGESMPVEKTEGSNVFASTIAQGGFLTLRAEAIGRDSTFGKIISMVEEAESQKGAIQRYADKFSAWYLPVVTFIAVLTYLLSGDLMATVAVMVVACACAFALATPVALLASVGSNAKRGVLIKGGKYIEALDRADVLLIDKTGTLTFGRPEISDIIPFNGTTEGDLLAMAASAEQYSDHPIGKAVVEAAQKRYLTLSKPDNFKEITANGVRASVDGHTITVGNQRLLDDETQEIKSAVDTLKKEGKTAIIVQKNGLPVGVLAARDTERSEAGAALENLREQHSFDTVELLTGDNIETARHLAKKLNIDFRGELLPEDKIDIVKKYQSEGHTVVMIGDGINDAPALAQADVGIAMGTTGTDVAIETADITLMRDDWYLVPDLFASADKTMRVIKWNFGFTTAYNLVGLSLAAFGILPPVLAAAAQSLPDVGILLNSSRLLTK
ncbi:ATPase P [Aliifodinibius salipaludis]|uniref:ATPase P n=1 Tax=Fodinibius salipaludis TaxID=2032627 RepID=A0A2A2GGM8_9BACT|nr:cation-translocating P-type ATPase [Aliifodinibius salipaludis]PAU95932.1 ATPase P [Aliifodinibius salipaludis]